MMVSRVLGAVAVFSGLSLLVGGAHACVLEPTELHPVQAELASRDTSAPTPPVLLAVDAFRRSGMTCTAGACVWSSCGNMGLVEIELAAEDDQTPAARVGYRLELVSG